ncbi:hypothetical protein FVE85_3515 [Porphyridium purpureum]|uniref:CCHC-type domain-containing protein n=1 Tax=Porphyridium purpureum TaxID=35688 RepID=A0A5J4YNU8_PORPP|nr:hypothetical protein FVE85_3515 [Porphyridium purpureum]|eukprot:POR1684..scf249_10
MSRVGQSGAGRSPHPREAGLVETLPLLTYDSTRVVPAAVVVWVEELGNYCKKEYGAIGTAFAIERQGRVYPTLPTIPQATPGLGEAGREDWYSATVAKEELKLALAARSDAIRKDKETRVRVFGLIMGQLSRASKEALAVKPGWSQLVRESDDPLQLLERVIEAHLTRGYDDPLRNQQYARMSYDQLRVGADESLVSFKTRFKAAVMALEAVGEPVPSSERCAADFILKLEGTRWDEAVRKCNNEHRRFDTVDQAMSFMAQFAYAKQPVHGRTWRTDTEHPEDEDTDDVELAAAPRVRECYNCGADDHLLRDCHARPLDSGMADRMRAAKERQARMARRDTRGRGPVLAGATEQQLRAALDALKRNADA